MYNQFAYEKLIRQTLENYKSEFLVIFFLINVIDWNGFRVCVSSFLISYNMKSDPFSHLKKIEIINTKAISLLVHHFYSYANVNRINKKKIMKIVVALHFHSQQFIWYRFYYSLFTIPPSLYYSTLSMHTMFEICI